MPKTITITKEDFDNAVTKVMESSMEDPTLKRSAEAMMLYTIGGVTFAKQVRDELFHDDCEETNG